MEMLHRHTRSRDSRAFTWERIIQTQILQHVVWVRFDDEVLLDLQLNGADEADRVADDQRNVEIPEYVRQFDQCALVEHIARNDGRERGENRRVRLQNALDRILDTITANLRVHLQQQTGRHFRATLAVRVLADEEVVVVLGGDLG